MSSEAPVDRVSSLTWDAAAPRLHARLLSEPPARVADVACGRGDLALDLATSYPLVIVDGWDADDAAIAAARSEALQRGVDDRVRFEVRDGARRRPRRRYDLVVGLHAMDDGMDAVAVIEGIRSITAMDAYAIIPAELGDIAVAGGFERENDIAFERLPGVLLKAVPTVKPVTSRDR